MAQTAVPYKEEQTFRAYDLQAGQAYAEGRRDYSPSVYETVIKQHTSTGGQLGTVLDVGCGPGMATRGLASRGFAHALGLDASAGMIEAARSIGGQTSTGEPIRFEVSSAQLLGQDLSPAVADGSIDLVSAATAAHWFDMAAFWPRAARVLRPGGSVALWTGTVIALHPDTPNAQAIQAALDAHQERYLAPFREPASNVVRNLYADLPLPWTLPEPVPEFDQSSFFRHVWDGSERFQGSDAPSDMDTLEKSMSTASTITRWREAHPEDVGTERDVIRVLRREMEALLQEAGVEKGQERVKAMIKGVLFVVKKKA